MISPPPAVPEPLPADASPPALGRDRAFLVLLALCLLQIAYLAPRLLLPDLNLDYPFTDGDTWDWIANGLYLAGEDVRFSGRPPLLPLLLALLDRLTLLPLFPLLNLLALHAALLALYRTAARLSGRRAAFAAAAVLLVNHGLQTLALQVMADVLAAALLTAAFAAFVRAGEKPRAYLSAGLALGLAAATQSAALLALPAAALAVVLARRPHLRAPTLWAGALLAIVPQIAWAAWKLAVFGTAGDLLTRYTHLLRLQTGNATSYAWAAIALLGPPAAVGVVAGMIRALRARPGAVDPAPATSPAPPLLLQPGASRRATTPRATRRSASHLAALFFTAGLALLFGLCYDWYASRFLVYALAPAGLFLAEALAGLRRSALLSAALLCALFSALPRPVPGNQAGWLPLWPVPPVLLHAPDRDGRLDLAAARPVLPPWRNLLQATVWSQVRGRTPPAGPAFDPHRVTADRSAVYLQTPAEAGQRYRIVTRLGNAVRKRVKLVPTGHFAPVLSQLAIVPLGEIGGDVAGNGDTALYRVRLPGAAVTWLLAAAAGGPQRATLDALAAARGHRSPAAPVTSPQLRAGLRRALAIRRHLTGSDSYVGILDCDPATDPAQLYLPFLLHSTETYVLTAGQAAPLLATATVRDRRRFGPAEVRRIRLFGRPSGVIDCSGAAS